MTNKVVNYKDIVDKRSIHIDCENDGNRAYRYSLTIPFHRKGAKTALVVMMNPSKATNEVSDKTVNNVLTRIYSECPEVYNVTITNLYPLYETYSERLDNHKAKSKINFDKIRQQMSNADFILLGWGKPANKGSKALKEIKYHEHALMVVEMIQSLKLPAFSAGELREGLYPKHLGRLSFKLRFAPIDLAKLASKIRNRISEKESIG